MILSEFLAVGGDPAGLMYCQVEILRISIRPGERWDTARFEGMEDGKAICRHNGVQENAWYIPYRMPPEQVRLVFRDGKPIPYDARPLTQR